MSAPATDYVIHFPESYLDYDKPWGNRRQMLVTDQHANILSNFLAILLALAGKGVYNIWRRLIRARAGSSTEPATAIMPVNSAYIQTGVQNSTTISTNARDDPGTESTEPSDSGQHNDSISLEELHATSSSETAGTTIHQAPLVSSVTFDEAVDSIPRAPAKTHDPRNQDTATIDQFSMPEDLALHQIRECYRVLNPMNEGDKILFLRIFDPEFWSGVWIQARDRPRELLWHVGILIIALVFYFGTLVLAILGPYPVIGDSVALSRYPRCGLYLSEHRYSGGTKDRILRSQYYNEIGRESRQYAKLCYGPDPEAGSSRGRDFCSYFYRRKIETSVWEDQPCPFRVDREYLCLGGAYGAYTVATGSKSNMLIEASAIGINTPLPYKFHRAITCSPLKTDGYVHPFRYPNSTHDWLNGGVSGYRYAYGSNNSTKPGSCPPEIPNCTFEWPYFPDMNRPYIMMTTSTSHNGKDTWTPIFDVDAHLGHTATHIILISNAGIQYPEASYDPIFLANATIRGEWFIQGTFQTGVLACLSRDLICRSDTKPYKCLLPDESPPDSLPDGSHSAPWTMLQWSTILGLDTQLDYLGAENLDAQSMLMGTLSAPLLKDQWKHEVRQMFDAVLAHTQIQARNLARGIPGQPPPGLRNFWGADNSTGFCTQYKFHAVGWKNISVSWFLGEFFGAILLCILGLTDDQRELRVENLWKSILAGLSKVCSYGPKIRGWLSMPFVWIFRRIRRTLAKHPGRVRRTA